MNSMQKIIIYNLLCNNIATVTFTKANGKGRRMKCTLKGHASDTNTSSKNIIVWDVVKDAWRTIAYDKISKITYTPGAYDK